MDDLFFNWKKKGNNGRVAIHKDVRVMLYDARNNRKQLGLLFANEIHNLFCDSGYVQYTVLKNRIYFKNSNNVDGYKLSDLGGSKTKLVKVMLDDNESMVFEKFIGDYELNYDSFHELYYIER